jgi:tetratricopeptide (TPR) repeat protein/tRNA A-37 threonylcarbamoyl transferase component Bud32
MHPERWTEIDNLFQSALERPTNQREEFLREACAGDEELEREVRSLLAAGKEAASFLLNPAIEVAAQAMAAERAGTRDGEDETAPGHILPGQIGRYRVLRLLGEGGMGVVYEAVQEHPHRTVALKVVKPGLDSSLLRRFEHESQALARLQHPGIAQIYEAGVADTGFGPQPYFAMEFIHGQPLHKYTEAHHLKVKERLDLMGKICQAVEHAHQRGLIHRDLKPGNILVDETGQPKILDFGVARVTDSDTQVTRQTDVGQLVGTLEYMSPEQVLADPMEIDTRSDVYALGVILYEMLAGRRPYKLSQRLHEAVLTIREEDPAPLSSVSGQYRGDIETIVAKALEKDKARRYGSAAELAEDIQRHLADEPILARPASAAYQLRKFARRNKPLVAGVAAVFAVLVAGVVASTWEATQARRERDRAAAAERLASSQRDRALFSQQTAKAAEARALEERNRVIAEKNRADTESAIAIAVNNFLRNDLLAQAGARTQAVLGAKPDRDLKVRTALDRAAKRIEGKFPSQPLVEASIRQTIGSTYLDLGSLTEAQRELERAVDVRRRLLGEQHKDTLESLNSLANVLQEQGRYPQAEALNTEILAIERRTLGDQHRDTLSGMNSLASVFRSEGKYDPAAALAGAALEMQRRLLGEKHPDTLSTTVNLARIKMEQGDYPQAETLLTDAMRLRKQVLGEEHPDTLSSMDLLSLVYRSEGKYKQAEQLSEQTLGVRRRVLGPEHPATVDTMNSLGLLYRIDGNYKQAEELLSQALEIGRRTLGEEHPTTLTAMNELPGVYWVEGRYADAEPLYTKVLEIQRRLLGAEHQETLSITNNLALVYLSEGKYPEGEPLLKKVLDARRRTLPEGHPDTLRTMNNLAVTYLSEGKYVQAEPLYVEARELQRRKLGQDHPDTLLSTNNLAGLYLHEGKYEQAEALYSESIDGRRRTLGEHNPDTLISMNDFAALLERRGDLVRARDLFAKVLEARRQVLGPEHPVTASTLVSLGRVLSKQQQYTEAEPPLREALRVLEKKTPEAWTRFNGENMLGAALAGQGKYQEAEPMLLSGYEGLVARESSIPFPLLINIEQAGQRIVQLYRDWGKAEQVTAWQKKLHLPQ